MAIDQLTLKSVFEYDPETGRFVYARKCGKRRKGDLAGSLHVNGYWTLRVNYEKILAHRAAVLWMTGNLPAEVDHKDGNRLNNRYENLRIVTREQNRWNSRRRSDNTSGFKGIEIKNTSQGYLIVKASISFYGKIVTKSFSIAKYGRDNGVKLAQEWLVHKRKELHGEFACDGSRSSQI